MVYVIIFGILLAAGYFISLRIHPLKKCSACNGTNRHNGSVYSYAYRRCRKCGGTGRQDRLGVRLFLGGTGDTGAPRR